MRQQRRLAIHSNGNMTFTKGSKLPVRIDDKRAVGIETTCQLMSCSRADGYRLAAEGIPPTFRLRGWRLVLVSELKKLVERVQAEQPSYTTRHEREPKCFPGREHHVHA